ncbi:MAG TPA: PRC-barrel domain-containing protein [Candidatus Saccharimonadales bacterium]|nr:PRC-barrel domain-containing protein [Candidatus Saccharimonadales bacterium]
MIRASDLLGCVVRTESGKKVGRVHDLRANTTGGDCRLTGLMVGRGGMLARLAGGGAGAGPTRGDDVVPWEAITHMEDGQITIRD